MTVEQSGNARGITRQRIGVLEANGVIHGSKIFFSEVSILAFCRQRRTRRFSPESLEGVMK